MWINYSRVITLTRISFENQYFLVPLSRKVNQVPQKSLNWRLFNSYSCLHTIITRRTKARLDFAKIRNFFLEIQFLVDYVIVSHHKIMNHTYFELICCFLSIDGKFTWIHCINT